MKTFKNFVRIFLSCVAAVLFFYSCDANADNSNTGDIVTKELERLSVNTVSDPETSIIKLPDNLDAGIEWVVLSAACEEGGYDLYPYEGESVTKTSYDIEETCFPEQEIRIHVISKEDAIICAYLSDNSIPGVWAVNDEMCEYQSNTYEEITITIDPDNNFSDIMTSVSGWSDRTTKRLEVINNQKDFDEAFLSADKNGQGPIPEVDFENYLVIAIAMGEQNSGGYSIYVNSVSETENYMQVNVESSIPGEGCLVSDALTYPYSFIAINKVGKGIIFSETVKVVDCD